MPSRYRNDTATRRGTAIRSAAAVKRIRKAIRAGTISYRTVPIKQGQRLDHYAQELYGDGRLWWILAACSNIGWALQLPPGTLINIPTDVTQVFELT